MVPECSKKSLGTLVSTNEVSRHRIGAFFSAFLKTEKRGMPKHPAQWARHVYAADFFFVAVLPFCCLAAACSATAFSILAVSMR